MTTWPQVPLRRVFRVVNGGTPTGDATNWEGEVPWATPVDLGRVNGGVLTSTDRTLTKAGLLSGSRLVPVGALVVSTRAPIGYVTEAGVDLAFNQGCRGLVPVTSIDSRYFRYQLSTMTSQLESRGQGSTFSELSSDGLASSMVVYPPFAIQRAIADFLDGETARIDALIAKKRRLIELLGERLSCQIDRIVWSSNGDVTPLIHLVPPKRRIMYGIVLPGPDVEDGVPIVKGGDVKSRRLNLESVSRTTREIEAGYVRSRLMEGDIVFAIRGGVGDVEVVPRELAGANITQDVARIAPGDSVSVRWLLHSLRSRTTQEDVQSRITGATIRGINIWDLGRVAVPVPDMKVQVRLAGHLDVLTSICQRSTSMLGRQIDILVEHRQALITAAVTGELHVAESLAKEAS